MEHAQQRDKKEREIEKNFRSKIEKKESSKSNAICIESLRVGREIEPHHNVFATPIYPSGNAWTWIICAKFPVLICRHCIH